MHDSLVEPLAHVVPTLSEGLSVFMVGAWRLWQQVDNNPVSVELERIVLRFVGTEVRKDGLNKSLPCCRGYRAHTGVSLARCERRAIFVSLPCDDFIEVEHDVGGH